MRRINFSFLREHKLALVICIILFILPFFWLKPGEMDLGGDSSRLFFYDPLNYLKNSNLYYVARDGIGSVEPEYSYDYALIPYLAILILLKSIFSSTILINLFNGVKLAGGFIVIYFIVREFLLETYGKTKKDTLNNVSVLSGVFYIVSQGSINLVVSWETALTSHNQFFIYPLIFFLLFKSLITHKYSYLWIALLISFIFSPNFGGLESIPPFFAFWPIVAVFLFLYIKIFGKKPISWKIIIMAAVLFLGVHTFHLLAQAVSLFDSGSFTNVKVFDKYYMIDLGLNIFGAVLSSGMATLNFLLPSPNIFLRWISFLSALIILVGFILNKKKEFLFISIFFFITFFFSTANITNVGVEFYKSLFYLPGFSMFRIFSKWLYVFVFFYALLFGFAAYSISEKLKVNYSKLFFIFVFTFLIISGIPLFSGAPINKSLIGGTNIKKTFLMDSKYEQVLEHIRTLPDDGKILVLPLVGFNYQFFFGVDSGAYLGLSSISHLTDKYSFTGERHFGVAGFYGPNLYSYLVQKYAKEKNYKRLNQLFTLMNIRYILYNADSRQYERGFSDTQFFLPESFPKTKAGYDEFIRHFSIQQIYKNGNYILYEFSKSSYNSTIFIPKGVYESNDLIYDEKNLHSIFIDKNTCNIKEFKEICKGGYNASDNDVSFKMINPVLYEVTIIKKKPQDTILLVMQHAFNRAWKLIIDKKNVSKESHVLVNGYANGWLLGKGDIPQAKKFTVFIKLDSQKYFWYGWVVTAVSLAVVIGLLVVSIVKQRH
ncbi:MAG: hypothetical protein HYV37_02400 [Candidatus Levyibacteriota bacterium]|nr:MAG: hypothetical protein HYV37_02400 [Candidatus Levybacteria bacterium]